MLQPDRHRLGHIYDYCCRIQTTIARFGDSYEIFAADEELKNCP